MKKISNNDIVQYWREHEERKPDERFSFLRKLHDKQWALMGYLMKADGELLNEAEHQAMYYLGTFAVGVMMREFPEIPAVPEETMVEAIDSNVNMLKFLATDAPWDFRRSIDNVIDASPQPDLLRFITEFVMGDSWCRASVRDENAWRLFAHLKLAIDAMAMSIPLESTLLNS